jgi:hypothetical protein
MELKELNFAEMQEVNGGGLLDLGKVGLDLSAALGVKVDAGLASVSAALQVGTGVGLDLGGLL